MELRAIEELANLLPRRREEVEVARRLSNLPEQIEVHGRLQAIRPLFCNQRGSSQYRLAQSFFGYPVHRSLQMVRASCQLHCLEPH